MKQQHPDAESLYLKPDVYEKRNFTTSSSLQTSQLTTHTATRLAITGAGQTMPPTD